MAFCSISSASPIRLEEFEELPAASRAFLASEEKVARAEESVGLFALFAIPYTLCEVKTALLTAASMAGSSELLNHPPHF